MRNIKKVLGLIIALSVVFTITTSAVSASALFNTKDTSTTTEAKKREPLMRFYINYNVVRTLDYGFSIDTRPKTTVATTEATTEAITEATTEATTAVEEITDASTPLAAAPIEAQVLAPAASQVVITEAPVPKADIPSTGDSSIAGVVALSLISAASFVIAKKK